MKTVFSFGGGFLVVVLKWTLFIAVGIVMFPALFLVIFLHEHWLKLID